MMFLLLGCIHEIAKELELTPTGYATPEVEPADPAPWRRWVLHGDPLARHPRVPATLVDLDLETWQKVAAANPTAPSAWWFAERSSVGTIAVPYFRGARLAAIEALMPDAAPILPWLVPLAEPTSAAVDHPRPPLAWLGADASAFLPVAERSALLGWLDGPNIDLQAPAALLADPVWARLATTPVGAMILARSPPGPGMSGAPDPQAHTFLEAATQLVLAESARDPAAKALRAQAVTLLGFAPEAPDVPHDLAGELLRRALPGLTAAAHSDDDAGLALVAHAVLRYRGHCPDAPCGGFDRLPELEAGARFGPGPARAAALWRVVAWDAAVNELWAAWDRPQVTLGMDRVVELVTSEDPRALDRSFLVRPLPDAAWILPITRALGGPEGTSKDALFRALYGHVATLAQAAQATAPDVTAVLERLEKRARASSP